MKQLTRLVGAVALALLVASPAEAQSRTSRQPAARASVPGWIGISLSTATSPGQELRVEGLIPDGPAQRAGVLIGDIIVQWNGRTDVDEAIRQTTLQSGDTVRLRIRRTGARDRDLLIVAEPRSPIASFQIGDGGLWFRADTVAFRRFEGGFSALMERQRDAAAQLDSLRAGRFRIVEPFAGQPGRPSLTPFEVFAAPGFGVAIAGSRNAVAGAELTDIGAGLSSYFGTTTGVLVLRIAPNTPAARAGLQEGDVIVAADGATVRTVPDLRRALSTAGNRSIPLEVIRHRERRTLTLGG